MAVPGDQRVVVVLWLKFDFNTICCGERTGKIAMSPIRQRFVPDLIEMLMRSREAFVEYESGFRNLTQTLPLGLAADRSGFGRSLNSRQFSQLFLVHIRSRERTLTRAAFRAIQRLMPNQHLVGKTDSKPILSREQKLNHRGSPIRR